MIRRNHQHQPIFGNGVNNQDWIVDLAFDEPEGGFAVVDQGSDRLGVAERQREGDAGVA
jgi:hypothetical protein